MTPNQKRLRFDLLKKIHCQDVYKEHFNNDFWEEYLTSMFGIGSCKDLSIKELFILLDVMEGRRDLAPFTPDIRGRKIVENKQDAKIESLRVLLGFSPINLNKFILKIFKKEKLSGREKSRLIYILEKMLKSKARA